MRRQLRWVFWIEAIVGGAGALLTVLTLLWKDWIEILVGVDPDHHSGWLEWAIATGFLAMALTGHLLARREWRRARLALD
jgi:hypothetical protein